MFNIVIFVFIVFKYFQKCPHDACFQNIHCPFSIYKEASQLMQAIYNKGDVSEQKLDNNCKNYIKDKESDIDRQYKSNETSGSKSKNSLMMLSDEESIGLCREQNVCLCKAANIQCASCLSSLKATEKDCSYTVKYLQNFPTFNDLIGLEKTKSYIQQNVINPILDIRMLHIVII